MKSMIWKELRENARWAALAFLGLLLGETYALSQIRGTLMSVSQGITLCSGSFLLVSAFGCSVVGAVLGTVQILPELRRDQWASLLHRPVPRSTIFFGKVVAGLLLYLLATCLPLLVSMAYAATPGNFAAPFLPQMAIPAASDVLLGGVFYFVALLLALHRGRWVGSKAVIALGTVAILMLHLAGGWPFLLPLVAIGVLLLATWGAMEGSLGTRPRISVWALGLFLLLGAQAGLLLVSAALSGLKRDSNPEASNTQLVIAHDGTLLLSTYFAKDRSTKLTDLEGKPITDERYVGNSQSNHQLYPMHFADRAQTSYAGLWWRARSSEDWVEPVSNNYDTPELWYLIKGERSYFTGYDRMSGRRLAICDAQGFKKPDAPIRPFAKEPQAARFQKVPYLFWTESKLYTSDFGDRQLSQIADFGSHTIYGAVRYPQNVEHTRFVVALDSDIRFLDANGALLTTLPYRYDGRQWPNIGITATADFSRTFLLYSPAYYVQVPGRPYVTHLDVFDGQMQPLANYARPAEFVRELPATWLEYFGYLTNMPAPTLGWTLRSKMKPETPQVAAVNAGILLGVAGANMTNRILAILCGIAVLLSIGAGVWARRSGLTRGQTLGWVVTTVLFGVPGFLAFRMCTPWPTQVRCPHCGLPRPVEAESCPRCRQVWQAVAPNGAEIFETA